MEASALKHVGVDGLRGPTPLLRLQSDDRLVAMTRRGNPVAYEALVARYQSRLLAFCRHMLGSREDAEDVLQEVFAAAFNAMIADERPLNVRPWLYRIARNRSLNHLRRTQAIGVDSMDVHLSENGASTADKVHRREEFRQLVEDVQGLAETQRTALLLREIDALSYDQIAEAMETTIPSVKSLLVRARVALAEAAEARQLTCEDVRIELGEVAEGLARTSPPVRRHVRSCDRCATFRKQLRQTNKALAAVFPVGPLLLLKKLVLANLGTTASAGGSAAAAAGASASAAGAGGALSAGLGAVASKAAAGLAAAAIVTAGAVEVDHAAQRPPIAHHPQAVAGVSATPTTPHVIAAQPQPVAVSAPARPHRVVAKTPDKPRASAAAAGKARKPAASGKQPEQKATAQQRAAVTTPAPAAAPVPAGAPQQASATATMPSQAPGTVAPNGGTTAPDEQPTPPPTTTATEPPDAPPTAPPTTTTAPTPPPADPPPVTTTPAPAPATTTPVPPPSDVPPAP